MLVSKVKDLVFFIQFDRYRMFLNQQSITIVKQHSCLVGLIVFCSSFERGIDSHYFEQYGHSCLGHERCVESHVDSTCITE